MKAFILALSATMSLNAFAGTGFATKDRRADLPERNSAAHLRSEANTMQRDTQQVKCEQQRLERELQQSRRW